MTGVPVAVDRLDQEVGSSERASESNIGRSVITAAMRWLAGWDGRHARR